MRRRRADRRRPDAQVRRTRTGAMRRVKRANLLTVLGGVLFVALILVGVVFLAGFWRVGSSYSVSAYVTNARGIAVDSTVFEAGLPVGLVTGVQRNGPDAILSLRIDHGVKPLPVDSHVQLGLRSLAGEADVLLYPGTSRDLVRNGGSLGLSQDQGYTEVDQILSQFAPPTERYTRQFFQGVGSGLAGEGHNLNATLGGFASLVNDSPPLTSTLAAQHNQVADIVQNFGNIMAAIGQRTQALQQFAQGAVTTFNDVAARDTAFEGLLKQLPFVVGGNWSAVRGLLASASEIRPVLNLLTDATAKLQPAIGLLTPGASNGIQVVNALGGASPALKNLLVSLEKLKPSATAALPAVHATSCQLNPMLRFIKPYGPDISEFFQHFGAVVSAYGDAHMLTAVADINPSALVRGVETQPPIGTALQTLLNAGLFHLLGARTGFHALPGPGLMHDTTDGLGDAGPIQWGSNHKFPHVTADCAR
jgi:phospholipid/cholesterol/gamma-HCH transport system substrate-binding protein